MIKSWMAIAAVTVLVAVVGNRLNSDDIRWFNRLQRPRWLTFERAIPIIWTVIFICAAWSAVLVWEADPGSLQTWVLMGFYLVLEMVTIAYTPVMCKLHSLMVGTIVGGTGALLGYMLAVSVFPISLWAFGLLVPYLIWSPIGTYTTWAMIKLNPEDK
ncbi:TspO/MBR family protein [Phormidium sp. CCY1219]|uniref:TspO/MBR family protein n=1 Tax=Phormidium sp. CCY1219 TaxID=2886104 RepID=UPI002D1F2438|nr:TspO/MBR family protein [Phormidium sp. CCY1219]MEB3827565.1 TspO/MBR family protein [Phormidium sp. CCY1219]